jgi:hypothetical protein
MKATVTNTPGILHLIENAAGRNRSVHEDKFIKSVDTNGLHVLGLHFPHNGVEMRTQWFCKMKESDQPSEIWLDVDFDILETCTTDIETKKEINSNA